MYAFFWALQLLTRIPVPIQVEITPTIQGRSLLYYPLVGLLLGGGLWGVATLLSYIVAGEAVELIAAILLTVWVLLTGGLHLDGVADLADAWVGGMGDRQRTLEIMKDPASGPMGVTALVLILMLKFAAILALIQQQGISALIWIPFLGRSLILMLFLTTTYQRSNGIASGIISQMSPRWGWGVLALSTLFFLTFNLPNWAVVPLLLLFFWLFRRQLQRRIGGFTGDCAGALVEISETLALITWVLYPGTMGIAIN